MRIKSAIRALTLALLVVSGAVATKVATAQEFTVNLKDTDIQELIQFVSDVTGTTIVVDPTVKGKVKVVSSKPVTKAELYDLFLSILDVHGYTAVRSGGVVRVIPNKNARSAPVDVVSGTASLINDEYVTQVIRLENISAAKLIPVLRPLVPQQAHMAAYAPSNAIIISDIRANIQRIAEIIDSMDQSAVKKTELVKLKYGVSTDVVEMLKTLEKSRAGDGDANEEATLVADKRTNSVIITADEVSIERIRNLIGYLDIPLEQSGNVRVMYLEYADATEVAEVLTRVMQNISRLDEGGDRNRNSNSAKSTIEADAGIDVLFDNTTGVAAIELALGPDEVRPEATMVEVAPAAKETVEENFQGLLDSLLDTLLGSALEGLSFGLPSLDGFGITELDLGGSAGGEWLTGAAELGVVSYPSGGCDEGCSGGTDSGCSTGGAAPWLLMVVVPLLRRRSGS